jgi:hypothetical protein
MLVHLACFRGWPAFNCQTLPGLLGEVLSTHLITSSQKLFAGKKKDKKIEKTKNWTRFKSHISPLVAVLSYRHRPPATAALLNAPGSEDPHRGPYQQA